MKKELKVYYITIVIMDILKKRNNINKGKNMEWIIGLIVIWLIWRCLTQKRIEETISEKTYF